MNIMVFDVPAESGGAVSVLNDFYNEVNMYSDKNINWIFVVSTPFLKETDNIRVLRIPWIKKSWGHRIFFDNIIAPKLIKEYHVNKVFSLQNVVIPHTKVEQVLYVHNSLPFVEYRFRLNDNLLLWTYQNIISVYIKKSIEKADKVIAQTRWMKKAFLQDTNAKEDKIKVIPPKINIEVNKEYNPLTDGARTTFFYPASGVDFKNHRIIIDACKLLTKKNIEYNIIFTLCGDENSHVKKFKKETELHGLNISFVGTLKREEVFKLYTKSILLFPSFVESSPLPLTEALLHKSIILASNCAFSKEILSDYKNAYFFNPFNNEELAELMESVIKNKLNYEENNIMISSQSGSIIDIILE